MGLLSFYEQTTVAVKRRFRENWGFPFIVAFLLLLLSAAVLSASGNSIAAQVAEVVADVAYLSLAAGVILQLFTFGRKKKRGDTAVYGSS